MLYDWVKWAVTGECGWETETQEALQIEYEGLLKDESQIYIDKLRKEIVCGDLEQQQVHLICKQLRVDPHPELIDILQSAPYFIVQDFTNIPAAIDRITAIYKTKIVKLKLKAKEYEDHIAKQPQAGKSTMQDWAAQLRVLSKWMAVQLNWHTLSVLEYTVYLNDFKSENKRNEQNR